MNAEQIPVVDEEPIGIVISSGADRAELPPTFEYVWGPAPEPDEENLEPKVA